MTAPDARGIGTDPSALPSVPRRSTETSGPGPVPDSAEAFATPFSHVGVTVPDGALEEAVAFYREAFDLRVLMGPTGVDTTEDSLIGRMCRDVFGEDLKRFRIAHLVTPNGVGIEIFECPGGKRRVDSFQFRDAGIFHMAFKDPNLEKRRDKILELGGKQHRDMQEVRRYYENEDYRMIYIQDPWGNVIELYSHDYSDIYSRGAYE